jgi:hypothetical protein
MAYETQPGDCACESEVRPATTFISNQKQGTETMDAQQFKSRFMVFIICWIILGIVGSAFFYGSKNTALKQKVWPLWILFIGVLFVFFASYTQGHFSYFAVIPILLISYLNIKNQKFCPVCGKSQYNRNLFQKQKFCSNCGTPLP